MNPLLHKTAQAWNRYWFTPTPALNLGLCRALFYTAMLLMYGFSDYAAWGQLAPEFFLPLWPYHRVAPPLLPLLGVFTVVWKISLFTSALGFFTRVSTAVAFLCGAVLLAMPHQFGKLHHDDALLVLVLGIMAFAHTGQAFSLDRVMARSRGVLEPPEPSGEFRWPIRAVWLCMSVIFLSAGYFKAFPNGVEYVFSDTMAIYLARQFLAQSSVDPLVPWATFIYASPLASRLLAAATIGFELFFPVVMFSVWARRLFVPAAFLGQVVIYLIMGPPFIEFWVCYLFFVPWADLLKGLQARIPGLMAPADPASQPT